MVDDRHKNFSRIIHAYGVLVNISIQPQRYVRESYVLKEAELDRKRLALQRSAMSIEIDV